MYYNEPLTPQEQNHLDNCIEEEIISEHDKLRFCENLGEIYDNTHLPW